MSKLAWNKIDWPLVKQRVFRIQRRIYKAKLANKVELMYYLQRRLTRSLDAKLLSVQQVTTYNKGRTTQGVDKKTYDTPEKKMELALSLNLNGKTNAIRRIFIPKPGKIEKRPLGIPTIQDRAKQNLAKLALEPEWEAIFETNSYGFRPGRSVKDAIEAIFKYMRKQPKYILDADITKCFDRINHTALLKKLNTYPEMEIQIKAWLEAQIMEEFAYRPKNLEENIAKTPQGGIISPLLANIALHGLETHLQKWYSTTEYPDKRQGKTQRGKGLGVIRYADDFLIINPSLEVIEMAKEKTAEWLAPMGLELNEGKTTIKNSTEGFSFLGFHIISLQRNGKNATKIHISRESKARLLDKIKQILSTGKAASAYEIIKRLSPVITGWGNYYRHCECSKEFQQLDNRLFSLLRAWVFRRKSNKTNRSYLKEKYFPSGKTYSFETGTHQDNWVLNGTQRNKNDQIETAYLPKLAWISSKNWVKITGNATPFDGNHLYWTNRLSKYNAFGTRINKLLKIQKMHCTLCGETFKHDSIIEVDHIVPRSKGGKDTYDNLQAIHKECHIVKTRLENFALSAKQKSQA